MRTVSLRLVDLQRSVIPIGFVDENLHTQVRIDCLKMFEEYPSALPSLTVSPPVGSSYPAVVTKDGEFVVWDVTASDCASEGVGEIQLTFVVGDVVAKSYIGRIRVTRSLNPSGVIPDPVQDWITQANAILAEIPNDIDSALQEAKDSGEFDGADGQDGSPGVDGYSPSAVVTKSGRVMTITVTDKDGTTEASVSDGDPGDPSILLLVQDSQPSDENNKMWIVETPPSGVQVPTYTEFTEGMNGCVAKPSNPTTGQFLKWNGTAWIASDLPLYTGGVS